MGMKSSAASARIGLSSGTIFFTAFFSFHFFSFRLGFRFRSFSLEVQFRFGNLRGFRCLGCSSLFLYLAGASRFAFGLRRLLWLAPALQLLWSVLGVLPQFWVVLSQPVLPLFWLW